MSRVTQPPIRVMRIIARMNVGGPAVQVTGLMRGFDFLDFDQRLYTGFCSSNEADYLDIVAIDVKAFRIEGFGRRVNFWGDIRAFLALIKAIRDFRPHVIHTHTAKAGFLGRIASIVSLQPSIRVHTFHGHLLNGYFGSFKRILVILAEKILAIFTHQLLAVGEKVREDLLSVGIGRINKFGLMPPGLQIGKLPDRKKSREFFGISTNILQCAFIGRVEQVKRPDRFLDVVSEMKIRGIEIEFFVAGDGELLEICRERIVREELPVRILGWQSDIEMVLAAADIVILTSDNEGTPLSLIQASMAALPVIATSVGSVPEVVIDGITGILTNFEILRIANALEELAEKPEVRRRLGVAGREYTLANFGVKRLVNDHEKLYKRLITQ